MKFALLVACALTAALALDTLPTNGDVCYSVSCSSLPLKCVETITSDIESSITLSNTCDSSSYCAVNDRFQGYCRNKVYFATRAALYPGDPCDDSDYLTECGYGNKACSNGVCEAVATDGQCASSADCPTTQYCSAGTCVNQKSEGEACTSKFECGRQAYCRFKDNTNTGECTRHFTLSSSDIVFPQIDNNVFIESDEQARLLCETGYADSVTGLCSDGPISIKKGEECTQDSDCQNVGATQQPSCKCGFNGQGKKYCDILPGDTPYIQARTAFKTYYDATKQCHLANRWGECGESKLYHTWKCKELQAKYYVELLNVNDLSCMGNIQEHLPIFNNINYHCSRAAAYSLFVHLWLALLLGFLLLWS